MNNRKGNNSENLVVRDEDGVQKILDGTGSFAAWLEDFEATAAANGFGRVLGNDPIDVPVRPDMAIERYLGRPGLGPPFPQDDANIREWKKEVQRWESACSIVLGMLKRSISSTVRDHLIRTHHDMITATRDNIRALLDGARARFGIYTPEKSKLNFIEMSSLPPFTSVATAIAALKKLGKLTQQRQGWNNAAEMFTDGQLRSFLLEKIRSWGAMVFVVGTIDAAPNMTYDACVDLMIIKVSQLEQLELLERNQSLEMASRISPLYAQQLALMHPSDTSCSSFQSSSIDPVYDFGVASRNFSPRDSACFNCHCPGHFCNMCPEPWCYLCGGNWCPPRPQIGKHHNRDCPTRPLPYSQYVQKRTSQDASLHQSVPIQPFKRPSLSNVYSSDGRGQSDDFRRKSELITKN